jgi:hypothetical protein
LRYDFVDYNERESSFLDVDKTLHAIAFLLRSRFVEPLVDFRVFVLAYDFGLIGLEKEKRTP